VKFEVHIIYMRTMRTQSHKVFGEDYSALVNKMNFDINLPEQRVEYSAD
jgi:hypothetical protein